MRFAYVGAMITYEFSFALVLDLDKYPDLQSITLGSSAFPVQAAVQIGGMWAAILYVPAEQFEQYEVPTSVLKVPDEHITQYDAPVSDLNDPAEQFSQCEALAFELNDPAVQLLQYEEPESELNVPGEQSAQMVVASAFEVLLYVPAEQGNEDILKVFEAITRNQQMPDTDFPICFCPVVLKLIIYWLLLLLPRLARY